MKHESKNYSGALSCKENTVAKILPFLNEVQTLSIKVY